LSSYAGVKKIDMPYLFKVTLKILMVSMMAIMFHACDNEKKQSDNTTEAYVKNIIEERAQKGRDLVDTTVSEFNEEERAHFAKKGLQYYPPDVNYRVVAGFGLDTTQPVFQMATTTDRKPNYRIYGYLSFMLKDTLCKLTVYQNYDYKDHPEFGNLLFIQFKDNTNEFGTYGGGRYIDIEIPDTDKVMLDFNEAYNPYCAYSHRWSCTLVPPVNTLDVAVFAGEKSYNDH
jgi:uncharacterized protein (DUF1684 family)